MTAPDEEDQRQTDTQAGSTAAPPSARTIAIATVVALAVAVVLLFTVVLPTEFDTDPLGTGELFGLSALAGAGEDPLETQLIDHKVDYAEFVLGPFESVEYKYLLDAGGTMVFSWQADGELVYDLHAEPAGLGEEAAESFEQGVSEVSRGTYHAPFTGIHGWFWENRTSGEITLRVHSAGFYVNATVFRDGGSFERELDSVLE